MLAYPIFGPGHSFILETDASTVGLGAVLQEDGTIHPIAYASRAVDKHERNYCISELETLGLVWAVRYFRLYLLGHPAQFILIMQPVCLFSTQPSHQGSLHAGL